MSVTSIHLLVHGRVQAVGYRSWAEQTANELGLNGWVRNLEDGTVEIMISGESKAVADMRILCERGPTNAHVLRVDVDAWAGEVNERFEQRKTA